MSGLYLERGYINIPAIDRLAGKNDVSFIVIIGGRQGGKTYGVLSLMLKENRRFILMRRTQAEADFIASGTVNPFISLGRTDISAKKDSKYTGKILLGDPAEDNVIGLTMALSTVAKIRGFSGADFTDLVFDEFIPERHVVAIKDEGDAFLNAIVTISGNRELEGRPPLRVWLLANANDIGNPILSALHLTEKVDTMKLRGQELSILADRGIMLFLPKSEKLMKARNETALVRATGRDSAFFDMAFKNEFSYNDRTGVQPADLRGYTPVLSVTGRFTINRKRGYYVSAYRRGAALEFAATEQQALNILRRYPDIRALATSNRLTFESLPVKEDFFSFFNFY